MIEERGAGGALERKRARLLQLVFEVKLTCPRCGDEMKTVSFMLENKSIRKILAHMIGRGGG